MSVADPEIDQLEYVVKLSPVFASGMLIGLLLDHPWPVAKWGGIIVGGGIAVFGAIDLYRAPPVNRGDDDGDTDD